MGSRESGRSRVWASAAVLCAIFSLTLGVGSARGAPGDLIYQGCLTGDPNAGPAGSNACAQIPSAAAANSGLDFAWAVAVSPDGTSLYALSNQDDAIARFSRDPSTGAVTYQDCITGETESGPTGLGGSNACGVIPSHQSFGTNSGFDEPYGIVISADGTSVYVGAQNDDSVAHFRRNTSTGVLTYQGCISGETGSGPGGTNACSNIPSHKAGGADSGLDKVRALAIDANGETVYAGVPQDDSIARFTRNPITGVLTYQECQTAELATGPAGGGGNDSCEALPGIVAFGINSGFDNPQAVTVSPNGASVYVASGNDASITRFARTAGTGAIAHQDCITRETGTTTCTVLSGSTVNGFDSGFDNLRAVVVSGDGASLYTVAGGDDSIVHFGRDTGTGALNFQGCLTGETEAGPGGTNACSQIATATSQGSNSGWDIGSVAPALAINGAGTAVYFGALLDDSVVQLDRNTATGGLANRRCLSSETETVGACIGISPAASFGANTALDQVNSLSLSADGSSLYTAAPPSDSVARFAVEPAPPAPPTSPQFCKGRRATISGTNKNDLIRGTAARDVIAGLNGKDKILGLGGNDLICGGAGKDRLLGGPGKDELLGQGGKDILKGGKGKDVLKGGPGTDVEKQ